MYLQARRIGLSPHLFWRLTLREVHREFAAARLRREDHLEELTFQAFQTVRVWVLTKNKKKMPKFADLIRVAPPEIGSRSPDQVRAVMEVIAARMGGRVRKRSDV